MFGLLVGAVVGVIGIASAIIERLRHEAAREYERWESERSYAEQQVKNYNYQVQNHLERSKSAVTFEALVELHFEAMKTADYAHDLLSDARVAVDAVGKAIKAAGDERDQLKIKYEYSSGYTRKQLRQEIDALYALRNNLFANQQRLMGDRDYLQRQVHTLNNRTHKLKITIRDNYGYGGREWYARLEQRTKYRQMGLLPPGRKY